MAPAKRGNFQDFWNATTGLELEPAPPPYYPGVQPYGLGWSNIVRCGSNYYYAVTVRGGTINLHGSALFYVDAGQIDAMLPSILNRLDTLKPDQPSQVCAVDGYKKWLQKPDNPRQPGVLGLMREISDAHEMYLISQNMPQLVGYCAVEQYEFEHRVDRASKYWENSVFEALFFSALIWLPLWPMIRRRSNRRIAAYLAVVPFLFAMPIYLGYAPAHLGQAENDGGILYPHLALFLRLGNMFDFERTHWPLIPQLLEPLCWPPRSMIMEWGNVAGPTQMAVLSLIIFVVSWRVLAWLRDSVAKAAPAPTSPQAGPK